MTMEFSVITVINYKSRSENLIICQSVGVPLVGTLSYRGNHKGLPLQDPYLIYSSSHINFALS